MFLRRDFVLRNGSPREQHYGVGGTEVAMAVEAPSPEVVLEGAQPVDPVGQKKCIVTLVHGTWGFHSPFLADQSKLRTALAGC